MATARWRGRVASIASPTCSATSPRRR
ncbi:hypothetical protein, partial [Burkholderia multivorans]